MDLTQDAVGELLSIKKSGYQLIESGRNSVKLEYQEILEKHFNIPKEKLFLLIDSPENRMKNNYEIRGEITVIFIRRKDGSVIETIIDTEDLELAKNIFGRWSASRGKTERSSLYVACNSLVKGVQKPISLHRLIMGDPQGMLIDHINHDTLDNRKANLRIATYGENRQNLKQTHSASGIRGVYWSKLLKKWQAKMRLNKKVYVIGYYDDIKDAEIAVKSARAKSMPYSQEALAN
jgi:transcriptional regulator with XRE-family HTH domain